MNLKLYQQKSANLFAENRLLKFGFVTTLVMSLSNWHAINRAVDTQRVVLMPVPARGSLWITGTEASADYLRHMARHITNMMGNYTASTARRQFEELLPFYAPESYAAAKTGFESLADQIERYPTVSSRMVWVGDAPLTVDQQTLTVRVKKERLVNGDVTRSDDKTWVIRYRIEDGLFQIIALEETEGNG
ncbi:MAG: TraE/TraK family type IV conjugative transfer system protein [Gammaproteobacteria bacterium]